MKRVILASLTLMLVVSCGTARKVINTDVHAADSTRITATTATNVETMVDTTKTDSGKITVIEIVFFDPVSPTPATDTTATEPVKPVIQITDGGNIRIDNANNIKSVKATTIETESTAKGETHEIKSETAAVDSVSVSSKDETHHEETTPVESPVGRNIKSILSLVFGILLLLLVGFMIWKFRKR